MAKDAYIITYPINAGKMFNLVFSHHRPEKLRETQHDVPIEELRHEYKDFDPRIKRIVDMIDNTVRPLCLPSCHVCSSLICLYVVPLASDGDRPAEVVVFSAQERRAHG